MRLLLGLLIYSLHSISASGQIDCVIQFSYIWTVDSDINTEIELGLPKTIFLGGYTSVNEDNSFYYTKLNPNHEATLWSHMSSEFCTNHNVIIDNFFKGDKTFYLLRLRTKTKEMNEEFEYREIKIPIDSLDFSFNSEKRQIIIRLPKIKTL